jgi:hypothetical protein
VPDPCALGIDEVQAALAREDGTSSSTFARPRLLTHPWLRLHPDRLSFGTWLGWVVDPDRPLVLLLDPADWDDAVRRALRSATSGSKGPARRLRGLQNKKARSIERATVDSGRSIGGCRREARGDDVRQAAEHADGHVPGAWHYGLLDWPTIYVTDPS